MASSDSTSILAGAVEKTALLDTSVSLPSVEEVLAGLPQIPSSLPARESGKLDLPEQNALFSSLQNELSGGTDSLGRISDILNQLWTCNSDLLVQAAESLANKSREREYFKIISLGI